ncbi:hypothetical protein IQ266_25265 [filamentous cyanobacterium LEGE 11480]|uniref:Uncharacterized protein n=1 Tax=Romeriopsis navalis LEGE 11480 TaxID=2777977 RepID=A0A928VQY8_9CYAN|nr:hypothetical protein [Romeriopsis navalis]MBE9033051.1 hypothetical protein [Romeriopsis navalis LEGE 11480]
MQTKRLIAVSSLLTISSLNLASSLPVSAANRRVTAAPPMTRVDAGAFRINKRQPVRFKAFAVKDPKTGKAISPNTILTLPNGKRVKAGAYYAELNRLEQGFSRLGHSLRQPASKVLLQEALVDRAGLKRDADRISASHYKLQRPEKALFRTILDPAQNQRTIRLAPAIKPRSGALQQLRVKPSLSAPQRIIAPETLLRSSVGTPKLGVVAQPRASVSGFSMRPQSLKLSKLTPAQLAKLKLKLKRPVAAKTYTKSWGKRIGKKNRVYAYINTKLQVKSHPNYSRADAQGNAGGYLFNRHAQLLRATAQVRSDKPTNKSSVAVKLNAFGQTVYSFQRTKKSSYSYSKSFSKSIDKRIADIRFSAGPIPMRAKFGVRGSAGVRYAFALNPVKAAAYAKVNPFVRSRVYGEGGVDIVVAEAGVGANLVLLNDDLDVRARAKIGLASNNKAYLKLDMSAHNKLTALKGKLYAYAGVYVPRWGIPPWKKKRYDTTLFNWKGLTHQGYLFDESYTAYF